MLVNYIYIQDYIYVYNFNRKFKISTILIPQLIYVYCDLFDCRMF